MRRHYDISKLVPAPNPFAGKAAAKTPVTIRLRRETIEHFKAIAVRTGLPYQRVINSYLDDCASKGRELSMTWRG